MKKEMNFVGNRKIFGFISLGIFVLCVVCTLIMGVELDVAFKGGSLLKYSYTGELDADAVDEIAETVITEGAIVDLTVSGNEPMVSISTTQVLTPEEQADITAALTKAYPDAKLEALGINALQPSMGQKFFIKCIVAVLLASLFLVIYIGLRFRKIGGISAGLFAVFALLNDLMVSYFAFVVLRIPLNDNFVAVMLTILGYSLNDTIVVYDRIRENRQKMGKDTPIAQVVNTSINQTFTRTLNTSICTAIALATVAVLGVVFGMDSIISLVIPMLVGVLSGFYTSVCLCAPLWTAWVEHRERKKSAKK